MATSTEAGNWSLGEVLRNGQFRSYWVASVADGAADGLWMAMLLWYASTASTPFVGSLIVAAGIVPALCLAPLGGVLADRLGQGLTVVVTTALRTLVLAVWLFVGAGGGINLLALGVVALIFDGIGGLHGPAVNVYMTSFLPPEAAPAARSAEATGQRVAQLIGIALGGAVLATADGRHMAAAVTMGASALALLLYGVVYRRSGDDRTPKAVRVDVMREPFRQRFVKGVDIARSHPVIRRTLVVQMVSSGLSEGVIAVGIPFLIRQQHLPERVFTLSLCTFFVGLFVGVTVEGLLVRRIRHMPRAGLTAFGGAGIVFVLIGVVGGNAWPVTVLLTAALGVLLSFGGPSLTGWTMQQVQSRAEATGQAVMGRFGAVIAIAKQSDQVGVLFVGGVASLSGITSAIILAGVLLLVLIAWSLRPEVVRTA